MEEAAAPIEHEEPCGSRMWDRRGGVSVGFRTHDNFVMRVHVRGYRLVVTPFVLSLSKHRPSSSLKKEQPFDRLRANGDES